MTAERLAVRAKGRTLAIAASACAHALVFGLLLRRLGSTPPVAEPAIMNVELAGRRPVSPPDTERPHRQDSRKRTRRSPETPPAEIAKPSASDDGPSGHLAEPTPSAEGANVRQALRRLLGCEHAALVALTPEERERCHDRLAAEPPRLRIDLDRHGFAQDPEPFLARRPHNGCKLRAAGDSAPVAGAPAGGKVGAAAGVQCAWSF